MAPKTPISLLQELMVQRSLPLPVYEFESVGDVSVPKFLCRVKTSTVAAVGVSRNKKEAKQNAAENALSALGLLNDDNNNTSNKEVSLKKLSNIPDDFIVNKNYVGILNEMASGHGRKYPIYEDSYEVNGQFKVICKFQTFETRGLATSKKQAKQIASHNMISKLKTTDFKPKKPEPKPKILLPVSEQDMEVLRNFENMAMHSTKSVLKEEPTVQVSAFEKKRYDTVEEAINELSYLNIKYNVTQLEDTPYCVALALVATGITTIGLGEDESSALLDALNEAMEILWEKNNAHKHTN